MHVRTFRVMLLFNLLTLVAAVATQTSLAYAFLLICAVDGLLLLRRGIAREKIVSALGRTLSDIGEILALILTLGAFIALMLASGVVPTMIHLSSRFLSPPVFLPLSFLLTALMSVLVGTALGTLSTLGLVVLSLGIGYGYPPALLVGVLVSGAFVADVASPISGLLRLTIKSYGTSFRGVVKAMAPPLVMAVVASAAAYFLWEKGGEAVVLDPAFSQALTGHFALSPLLLVIPFAVLLLAAIGVPTVRAIGVGVVITFLVTWWYQGVPLAGVLRTVIFGFSTDHPALAPILKSGGVLGMVEVLFIVIGSVFMTTLLSLTGELEKTVRLVIGPFRGEGRFNRRLHLLSGLATVLTCDQTVGIVLPAAALGDQIEARGITRAPVAASVAASGIILAPLFPWNVNALVITGLTGVSAVAYAPYALFCSLFFVFSYLWTYLRREGERS